MADLNLTEDERAVILKMREWKDGIPENVLPLRGEGAVYISLVSARAELYRLAIRYGHNDVWQRHERMHKLISPGLLIELCKAWSDLRERIRDDEERELLESGDHESRSPGSGSVA